MACRGLNTPLLAEKVSLRCKRMVRNEEHGRVIRTVMANEFKDHRKLRAKWRQQGNALIEDAKVTAKFRVCSRLPVNSCDRTSARPDDVVGKKRWKVRIASYAGTI